jgi:hypothetical protein
LSDLTDQLEQVGSPDKSAPLRDGQKSPSTSRSPISGRRHRARVAPALLKLTAELGRGEAMTLRAIELLCDIKQSQDVGGAKRGGV